jgi:hydrogenase maturation factor
MESMIVIDRIESGWAVAEHIESGISFDLPLCILPERVREGDVVVLHIIIDEESTRQRKEDIQRLIDENMEYGD